MIYEKIKIYVTPRILEIIEKDAESFEFFKKDGVAVNKNDFLTKLIVNFSDDFRLSQNQKFEFLKNTIGKKSSLDDFSLDNLCAEICRRENDLNSAPEGEKFTKLISLKPTKESGPVIEYIENCNLHGSSLSEYFRNMFATYSSLPQDKRESIIFKNQKIAILEAIKSKKKIFITVTHSSKSSMEVCPYALVNTKEEMHGYLLACRDNSCLPLRMSRITGVTILQDTATFSERHIKVFDKMIEYGPQFPCGINDAEIQVELDDLGKQRFKKFYVHRPVPYKVEGDVYFFRCSHDQVISYFKRFGLHAYILSPEHVRRGLMNFHKETYRHYKKREEKEKGAK